MTGRRLAALAAAAVAVVLLGLTGCTGGRAADPVPSASPTPVTSGSGPALAPAATLTLLDGSTRALRGDGERAAVLVFFSSWCSWCRQNQAALNAFADEHRADVTVIGIAGADEASAVATYVQDNAVTYPVGLDPDLRLFRAYAVSEPPLVALVSPSGELVRGWPGGVDMASLATAVSRLR